MSKYYDSKTETFKSIPDAPCYVLSNDTFMSDWGPAKGKINTCIVPCNDMSIAMAVETYIETRSDQNRIRIVENKPKTKAHVLYSLVPDWILRAKEI